MYLQACGSHPTINHLRLRSCPRRAVSQFVARSFTVSDLSVEEGMGGTEIGGMGGERGKEKMRKEGIREIVTWGDRTYKRESQFTARLNHRKRTANKPRENGLHTRVRAIVRYLGEACISCACSTYVRLLLPPSTSSSTVRPEATGNHLGVLIASEDTHDMDSSQNVIMSDFHIYLGYIFGGIGCC